MAVDPITKLIQSARQDWASGNYWETPERRDLFNQIIRARLPKTLLASEYENPTYGLDLAHYLDPARLDVFAKSLADVGQRYPNTVRALSWLEPTLEPESWAHTAYPVPATLTARMGFYPTGEYQWGLGLRNDRLNLEELTKATISKQMGQWWPGGYKGNAEGYGSIFQTPYASVATHEAGHAYDELINQWFRGLDMNVLSHEQVASLTGGLKKLESLKSTLAAESLNQEGPSMYAHQGSLHALDNLLKQKDLLVDPSDSPGLMSIDNLLRQSERIEPHHVENLSSFARGELASEPLAEVFAARETAQVPGVSRALMSPVTKRALDWGDELSNAEGMLQDAGLQGASTPEMLAKGAGAMAAFAVAPKLIDKYVSNPLANRMAKGALQGAGLGGILGPEGAAIGAGIGGGAALLSQVL